MGDFNRDGIDDLALTNNGSSNISILLGAKPSASLTIALNPNSAPTDITLSPSDVNENVAIGTVVGTFSTTDPDMGNTFTYTLVSGSGDTDNGSFTIDGDELKLNISPDFEAKPSYSILVRTTDGGGLFYEEALRITINNLAEEAQGTAANDALLTSDSADTLDGLGGADTMTGGNDNDLYFVDNTGDVIVEVATGGVDTVSSTIDYTLGNNLENLILGGAGNLSGTGNNLNNIITGNWW